MGTEELSNRLRPDPGSRGVDSGGDQPFLPTTTAAGAQDAGCDYPVSEGEPASGSSDRTHGYGSSAGDSSEPSLVELGSAHRSADGCLSRGSLDYSPADGRKSPR